MPSCDQTGKDIIPARLLCHFYLVCLLARPSVVGCGLSNLDLFRHAMALTCFQV